MHEKSLEDILASLVVFTCALIVLLVVGGFAFRSFITRPDIIRVHVIEIQTDSVSGVVQDYYSKAQVDSIVSVFRLQEDQLEQRQKYIIEKEEWSQDYKNALLYIVTIIIAIAGFFGYKSMKDVKKDCSDMAERISKDTAEIETREYLNSNIKELVNNEMKKTYSEQSYNTIVSRIKDDLINLHKFVTNEVVKQQVIDLLKDWSLNLSNNNQSDIQRGSSKNNSGNEGSVEPQDFND